MQVKFIAGPESEILQLQILFVESKQLEKLPLLILEQRKSGSRVPLLDLSRRTSPNLSLDQTTQLSVRSRDHNACGGRRFGQDHARLSRATRQIRSDANILLLQ